MLIRFKWELWIIAMQDYSRQLSWYWIAIIYQKSLYKTIAITCQVLWAMWTNGYAMIPIRMRIVTTSRRRLFRTAHKAYKKRARAYLASFTITCFLMIKCLSCVKLRYKQVWERIGCIRQLCSFLCSFLCSTCQEAPRSVSIRILACLWKENTKLQLLCPVGSYLGSFCEMMYMSQ